MVTKFPALTLTTTPCLGASGGDLPGGAAGGIAGHTGEGVGLATAELILVLNNTLEVGGGEAGEAGSRGVGGAAWAWDRWLECSIGNWR